MCLVALPFCDISQAGLRGRVLYSKHGYTGARLNHPDVATATLKSPATLELQL